MVLAFMPPMCILFGFGIGFGFAGNPAAPWMVSTGLAVLILGATLDLITDNKRGRR